MPKIFKVTIVALYRFYDLPSIAVGNTRHFKAVLQQRHAALHQLIVVILQLFFVHFTGVFPEFRKKLLHISGQIIHHADACCTQHVVILTVHSIVDQTV